MSMKSTDNVQGVHRQYPGGSPWTMARESTDNVQEFMDSVQGVHGQCPGNPQTMSMKSTDNVQGVFHSNQKLIVIDYY